MATPGVLFCWGRNSDGQCGDTRSGNAKSQQCVALPHPIQLPRAVVAVACGTGQQGCTFAVLDDGSLYTFGNDSGGRLGHLRASEQRRGSAAPTSMPRKVEALAGVKVVSACCSDAHALCVTSDGALYSWGKQGRSGCLGRPSVEPNEPALPALVPLPAAARAADCESGISAAVLADGALCMWGSNQHGRLGLGKEVTKAATPTLVPLPEGCGAITSFSLGSLYTACICADGEGGADGADSGGVADAAGKVLLTWGYGGHGNLGHGTRSDLARPTRVAGEAGSAFAAETALAAVACTRGQEGVKGGLYPRAGGTEGPHTLVIGGSGGLYTFGTCHKGLLCNLGPKTGGFGEEYDELTPYRVGAPVRNGAMPRADPISPYACWPPERYASEPGPLTAVSSGHIHAAALGADGQLWAWGCGSNDGRCGVERYLNMSGEGKPPHADSMKCYMMGPHRVGVARPLYWPAGPALDGVRVTAMATGRNHMACIGVLGEGKPAAVVHGGFEHGANGKVVSRGAKVDGPPPPKKLVELSEAESRALRTTTARRCEKGSTLRPAQRGDPPHGTADSLGWRYTCGSDTMRVQTG